MTEFIKENKAWTAVFAVSLAVIAAYLVWFAGHPRIIYVTGDGPKVETQIVPKGEKTLPPLAGELEYDGLMLEGWYTDSDYTEKYEGGELYSSLIVYAKWVPAQYTVTYNTESGTLSGQTEYTALYGETLAAVEAPSAENGSYTFLGWYTEPELENQFIPGKSKITSDLDLWASFGSPSQLVENEGLTAPILTINANGSISKGSYTTCTVSISNTKGKYAATDLSAQIRGRGNSTWNYDKKPYRLKFDEKINLFGMGSAKDWILLANCVDMSMLRNYTVYKMAQEFTGCEYTTDCMFVHVYIGDDYRGLYLLTEQVETGTNRVDVGDGTDENGNALEPEECGFLLECGNGGANDGQAVFYPKTCKGAYTDHVVVKSPDADVITKEQLKYINNYYNDVQKAIGNHDFDAVCELMDIDTVVDSFICAEYVLSGDMGYDFFCYMEPGGKLCMGPLWDYDQSSGCSEWGGYTYSGYSAASTQPWYDELIQIDEFRELVIESWMEHYDYLHSIPDQCYAVASLYENDINLNYERWEGFLGSTQWRSLPLVDALKTYPEHVDYFVEWITNRMDWIEEDLGIK